MSYRGREIPSEETLEQLRIQVTRRACAFFDYNWPAQLTNGIMFFEGERITIEEFVKQSNLFKGVL